MHLKQVGSIYLIVLLGSYITLICRSIRQQTFSNNIRLWNPKFSKWITLKFESYSASLPVPVGARSKTKVCGRSSAEIVCSNPTEGMDVSLLWVLCVVRQRSLWRADHSYRGVLLTVVCRCVWSRNLVNEEAMAHWGDCHAKNKLCVSENTTCFKMQSTNKITHIAIT